MDAVSGLMIPFVDMNMGTGTGVGLPIVNMIQLTISKFVNGFLLKRYTFIACLLKQNGDMLAGRVRRVPVHSAMTIL